MQIHDWSTQVKFFSTLAEYVFLLKNILFLWDKSLASLVFEINWPYSKKVLSASMWKWQALFFLSLLGFYIILNTIRLLSGNKKQGFVLMHCWLKLRVLLFLHERNCKGSYRSTTFSVFPLKHFSEETVHTHVPKKLYWAKMVNSSVWLLLMYYINLHCK